MVEFIWECRTCGKLISDHELLTVIVRACDHLRRSAVCGIGAQRRRLAPLREPATYPLVEAVLDQIELWFTPEGG